MPEADTAVRSQGHHKVTPQRHVEGCELRGQICLLLDTSGMNVPLWHSQVDPRSDLEEASLAVAKQVCRMWKNKSVPPPVSRFILQIIKLSATGAGLKLLGRDSSLIDHH